MAIKAKKVLKKLALAGAKHFYTLGLAAALMSSLTSRAGCRTIFGHFPLAC